MTRATQTAQYAGMRPVHYVLAMVTAALAVIVAVVTAVVTLVPVLAVLVGLLPVALPVLAVCAYVTVAMTYLLFAQRNGEPLLLRWHPLHVWHAFVAICHTVLGTLWDPIAHRTVRHLGARLRHGHLFRLHVVNNVQYDTVTGLCLDLYLARRKHHHRHHHRHARHTHANDSADALEPTQRDRPRPVIVFLYGGAWNSGSKELYAALGHHFGHHGFVCVIPDYRIYPRGTVDEMVHDIAKALAWVKENIPDHGGDPDQIHLIGHSAGSHLLLLTLLMAAFTEAGVHSHPGLSPTNLVLHSGFTTDSESSRSAMRRASDRVAPTLPPPLPVTIPPIASCVLLAGVYDTVQHLDYERRRSVHELSGMQRANKETKENMLLRSPTALLSAAITAGVADPSASANLLAQIAHTLPKHVLVAHGTNDTTVPVAQSMTVADLLRAVKCDVHAHFRTDMAHTVPVADLMHASPFFNLVCEFVNDAGQAKGGSGETSAPVDKVVVKPKRRAGQRANGRAATRVVVESSDPSS
ncbi:hypothetical protein AMAG_02967 [Allomyces macrogynus ATCC 38327]|uniref:BD-FAE-like domain-containing protein n=1 Tax=Allomyces macrogynus (strain ATCC 38327) TaxID=578462 RepID=A0A0L0S3V2_ALLM3|nr:hypothetical protein AMAG_02967 [Allomyces macrogynus ATCC 38327]|eukprot:KNE57233.1 hypothetical protein AMAG_02967 [Allomyces macrogynus ATCC 38327]